MRTVHGFGYAFTAEEVQEILAPALGTPSRCSLLWGKRKIRLVEGLATPVRLASR